MSEYAPVLVMAWDEGHRHCRCHDLGIQHVNPYALGIGDETGLPLEEAARDLGLWFFEL